MKVFIDGKEGTTGLRIYSRLEERGDVELITLPEEKRKDAASRKEALNSCDVAFLCLPDEAAIEAAAMVENPSVVVLDTSTAHRTSPDWDYGFPELSSAHREKVSKSQRIAVPGCHASGFVSLIYPLVAAGALPKSALLSCHCITGYSGGGKKMIKEYEASERGVALDSPRQYGVAQSHKHLPEMRKITGIDTTPIFCPIVADYYSGMLMTVTLFAQQLNEGYKLSDLKEIYQQLYKGPVVKAVDSVSDGGFQAANGMSGKDSMQIAVEGNEERILLMSRFDNLGKGASGAALQCMNIRMGLDETTGLCLL